MRNKAPLMGIMSMNVCEQDEVIVVQGRCILKYQGCGELLETSQLRIDVSSKKNVGKIEFASEYGLILPKGFQLNKYRIELKKENLLDLDIQNKLILNYKGEFNGRILYSIFDMKDGRNKNSKVFFKDGMAMYFRQSKYNSLGITVRPENQYDYPKGQERIKQAYKKAKNLANKDIVLMYEKNCSRFEESASILYKRLIDQGYSNVYFVVNMDNPRIQNLSDKYKHNLIEKDSDKHLEYFFASNKWISSESTEHALQLRIANKLAMDKMKSKSLQYIFLQHGVMYMVSLNSELRAGFRKSGYKLHRIVVSSEAEAQHFIDSAGMKKEELYVTGLAKFDECYRKSSADGIVIMPTWRRWESNQARLDLENTKYYKMVERMYNAVPNELKKKVQILPHPLMAESFKKDKKFGKSVCLDVIYDDVLRNCDILITDYSSIAYDAFYRGANVIFCWEEKEKCMEYYGEGSFLMLNETNAFGTICMNEEDLKKAIITWYGMKQTEENIKKYREIVKFHDGKNTERIIEKLKEDNIIS